MDETNINEINLDEISEFTQDVPEMYQEAAVQMRDTIKEQLRSLNDTPKQWKLDDSQKGTPLAGGKFGRVYVAREKISKYHVAIKVLFIAELITGQMEHQVLREIEIQSHLHHPNILRLLTYFHDEENIYLVLEFAANGSLFDLLATQRNRRFSDHRAAKYIYQVADALKYCHLNNVMLRDIKPENLLVDIDHNVKIADFGWSVHAPSNRRKTICGTLDYLPPEMVKNKAYSEKVDNWCLGVLLYEFQVGRAPFESDEQQATLKKIVNVEVDFPSYLTPGGRDLIEKLLRYNPERRASLDDVMSHEWITSNLLTHDFES